MDRFNLRKSAAEPELIVIDDSDDEEQKPTISENVPRIKVEQLYGPGIENFNVREIEDRLEFIRRFSTHIKKFLLMIILNGNEKTSHQFANQVVFNENVKAAYSSLFGVIITASSSKYGQSAHVNYKLDGFPNVLLVDPRTGERICSLHATSFDPNYFVSQLYEVSAKYPSFEALDNQMVSHYGGVVLPPKDIVINNVANVRKRRFHNWEENDLEMEDESCSSKMNYKRFKFVGHSPPIQEEFLEDGIEDKSMRTIDMDEYKKYEGPNNGRRIQFCIQLPDGKRENLQLNDSSTMKAVFYFIAGLGYNIREYVIIHSFPKQTIAFQHFYKTLKDIQFHDREFLLVDRK
uniref:UBX domain-containing protein n=1 Tax=Rhabditophanes sp. KR3021 TaxID=114890 RepID=A0AC35TQC9_9BILA